MGDIMVNKISYLVMSLVFFNVLFVFYYYFKIVNFLYIDFLNFNKLVNILFTNLLILTINIVYMGIFYCLKFRKFSYVFSVVIGFIIGVIISVFVLSNKGYEVVDYLGIISYFVINFVFISYSLYFEKEKELVFK